MSLDTNRRRPKYPSGMLGVYTSVVLCILSVVLALLLLSDKPWTLLYYFGSSFFITAIVFEVKNHILSVRESKKNDSDMVQTKEEEQGGKRWGLLLITLLGSLSLIVIPLALAYFFDPVIWVILLVSLTTGVSVAEVTLYVYLRRP